MSGSLLEKNRKKGLSLLILILLVCPILAVAQNVSPSEYSDTLNSVVIVGDKVSMTVCGDTTIYDASRFSTLRGGSLKDLLLTMPGISIKDGVVYVNGERVGGILVNGKPLFLNDIQAALKLLYADEVKSVKVYDQRSQLDYMILDSLDKKEPVVDIKTKRDMNSIKDFFAGISLGHHQAGTLFGSIQSYTLNKPSAGLDITYQRNAPSVSLYPCDKVSAVSMVGLADKERRMNLQNNLGFQFDLQRSNSGNYSQYVGAMQGWKSESESTMRDVVMSLNESFNVSKTLSGGRDKLEWYASFIWRRSNNESSTYKSVTGNSVESIADLRSTSLDNAFEVSSSVGWTHKFKKEGRLIKPLLFASFIYGTGDSGRVDTTVFSSDPTHLELGASRCGVESGATLIFRESFTRTSSLQVDYRGSLSVHHVTQTSFDWMNSLVDAINTYDYRSCGAKNNIGIAYSYRTRYLELRIGGKLNDEFRRVLDQYPASIRRDHNYLALTPDVLMNYRKGHIRIKGELSGQMITPSVEQTRDFLDNGKSFSLRCGNPSLCQSTVYKFSLLQSYTVQRLQTIFNVNVGMSMAQKYVTQDVSLFQSETYLADYDYTCPAGSRLVRPVNASGYVAAFTSLSADIKSSPLKSTFRPMAMVNYTRTPFSNDGIESFNPMFEISCGLGYVSSFSNRYLLSWESRFGYSRYYREESLLYNSITGSISSLFKANPIGGLWLEPSFSYQVRKTSNGLSPYNNSLLSASISYKFGKNANMEAGVQGYDLLNDNRLETLTSSDIMIMQSWSTTLGRTVLLFFRWRFR